MKNDRKLILLKYSFGLRFIKFLAIAACFSFSPILAQNTSFQVNDNVPIEQMVQALQGNNVQIFNITHSGHTNKKPVGEFKDVLGILGLSSGLLMTSGSAKLAIGPNNSSKKGAGDSGTQEDFDNDLGSVVPGEKLYDLVVIEFDISVKNNILSFNYIFGSEEYPEYERQYNDVFGFFISGPGINGIKNLATVNGTIPVSVKSINSTKNSNLFVSNGGGDNPAQDFYLQYDGFTKKLVAKTEVIPCETYHIKLAIADARDDILDSGVFIEKGSFNSTSKLDVDVAFEHKDIDYVVEGCNKGYFVIKKNLDWIKHDEAVTYGITLSGSAENGIDYPLISNTSITIPANQDSIKIEIDALSDGIPEGTETVTLDVNLQCGGSVIATASATMDIKDVIQYPIHSKVCKDVLMPINTEATDQWQFTWDANGALSCTNCTSPDVQLLTDMEFGVHIKDLISGCETDTIAYVTIQEPTAYFTFSTDVNYPLNRISFKNHSENTDTYEWDYGDGQTSMLFESNHTYNIPDDQDSATFNVTLKARAFDGKCNAVFDTTVVVYKFFLPNVITPNNDRWNQQFVVKGIEPGVWRMRIYDRWGKTVFNTLHYNNDWEGDNVVYGVYFFKLVNPPGDREYKGWVHVIK